METSKEKDFWAGAKCNKDFMEIITYSRVNMLTHDRVYGKAFVFTPPYADAALGEAVLQALAVSRKLKYVDEPEFTNERVEVRYKAWIEDMKQRFGYKTKRAMFGSMQSCSIKQQGDMIIFSPTNHESLEGWDWTGITPEDDVHIPADSPPEAIGAALQLAFSRCIGRNF